MPSSIKSGDTSSSVEQWKRRSARILLRIPIEVKGTGTDGKPFQETTYTLAVNRHGARIALKNGVQPAAQVSVTNLQNRVTCPFRVVGRVTKSLGEGPEWGVECLEPERNFWGIFFPEKTKGPPKEEVIDALLECSTCHSREMAQLTLEKYQSLSTHQSLSRGCPECGAITEWKFGFIEGEREEAVCAPSASAGPASAESAERRRAKRVTVKVPVRIRLEEIGQTENLSNSGVCFTSDLMLRVGDRVQLTVGYTPEGQQQEVPARVVWRQELEGANRALYGVQLE